MIYVRFLKGFGKQTNRESGMLKFPLLLSGWKTNGINLAGSVMVPSLIMFISMAGASGEND